MLAPGPVTALVTTKEKALEYPGLTWWRRREQHPGRTRGPGFAAFLCDHARGGPDVALHDLRRPFEVGE